MTSTPIRSTPTSPTNSQFDSAVSKDGAHAPAAGVPARSPAGQQPSPGLDGAPPAAKQGNVRRNRGRGGEGRANGGGARGGSTTAGMAPRRSGDVTQAQTQARGAPDRPRGDEGTEDAARAQRGSAAGLPGRGVARVSANYLLNFQYDSRMGAPGRGNQRGGSSGGRRRPPMPRPQKYDKDKFLQANFRFLVSDAVDVSRFEADADLMFDWDDVLQVEMLSIAAISCPISLDSPPICPHITPCGHIFSMSSIMQHLLNHGGDKLTRWAPCPLCYQPLVARELRMVQIRQVSVPNVGDTVTFRLLRRPKTSILPQPVPDTTSDNDSDSSPRALGSTHITSPPSSLHPGGHAAPWAGATAALGAAATLKDRNTADAGTDTASPLLANPFGKFATVADAAPLWHVAASELAECAVELTKQGGLEAALEAPSIYAALDALAVRARRFAERRQELLEASGQGSAQGSGSNVAATPAEAGAKAEAAVRAVFMASVDDAKMAVQHKEQRAKVETDFPSLPAGSPPASGPGFRAPGPVPVPSSALSASAPVWAPAGIGATAAATAPAAQAAAARHSQQPAAAAAAPAAATAAAPPAAEARGGAEALEGDSPRGASAELHFQHAFSEDEDEGSGDQADGNSSGTEGEPTDAAAAAPARAADAPTTAASAGAGSRPFGREALDNAGTPQQSAEALFGTSPNTSKLNTATADGNFYTYQAEDGQWLFLHPLNLRTLLHHYGAYAACPPKVSARLLEVEDVEQNEGVRRRCKALSHLPLRGTYRIAECELVSPILPPESLAPFADEARERANRRKRRAEGAARERRREEAAARAAAATKAGPSEDELRAMPQLRGSMGAGAAVDAGGGAAGMVPDDVAEAMAIQASLDEQLQQQAAMASSPPAAGISFAHMTRMGYAATGPVLSREPLLGSSPQGPSAMGAWGSLAGGGAGPSTPQPASPAPAAAGVWGAAARAGAAPATASSSGAASAAGAGQAPGAAGAAGAAGGSKWLTLGAPKSQQTQAAAAAAGAAGNAGEAAPSSGKKGKKPTLLFSTAQRRY